MSGTKVDITVDRNNITAAQDIEAEVGADALAAARESFPEGTELKVLSGILMWEAGDEPHTMRLKGVLTIGANTTAEVTCKEGNS